MLYRPPGILGASFFHVNAAATSASTLITAASNTDGAILRWLEMMTSSTAALRFYIDAVAPTVLDDTAKRSLLSAGREASFSINGDLPLPLLIPAGLGLFVWNAGGLSTAYISGGYDLK